MRYGQFCPIAKSMEIIGERWTVLILREILMGGCRFNGIQRGLGTISPALLSKRLESLETHGLVARRKIAGQRGYEYFPTKSAKELQPILMAIGNWGMKWAKDNLIEDDYDIDLLMLYLERSIIVENLPGRDTLIRFEFADLKQHKYWWLVVKDNLVDVCVKDPGRDVDVYFSSTVRTMTDAWLGHVSWRRVIRDGDLVIIGPRSLTRNVTSWLANSDFEGEYAH